MGTVKEHGYENLLQKAGNQHKDHQKAEKTPSPSSIHTNSSGGAAPSSLTSITNSVKVVHMSVRKTQSDPPDQLPSSRPSSRSMLSSEPPKLLPRNPTTSVVVI